MFAKIQTRVAQNGLRLHPDKTRVVNGTEKGQGFEFLGYRFATGRRWVRSNSWTALRDAIRQKTGRIRSGSLETIIRELNRWPNAFFAEHGLFTLHKAHVLARQSR